MEMALSYIECCSYRFLVPHVVYFALQGIGTHPVPKPGGLDLTDSTEEKW